MIPHQFYQAISSLLLVTHMNHVKSGLICVPFSFTDLTVTAEGLFHPDFPIGEDFSAMGAPLSLGNGIVYNNSAAFVAVEGDPVASFELNGAYEGILTGDIGLSNMTVVDPGSPLSDCMGYVDGTVVGDHHLLFDLDGVAVYGRDFRNFTEHGSFSFNVTGAMQLNIVMFPDDPNSFCIPLLIGNPRLCTPAPSDSPTTEPTAEPTVEPTAPSESPTRFPSESPTRNPSETPSESPTRFPSETPSESPTRFPSETPTRNPSETPSESPTRFPSESPTRNPSETPSESPTRFPSESPTRNPSETPSESPTRFPSESPTRNPSETSSESPTRFPSETPSESPTAEPTVEPTVEPTADPSYAPSKTPSNAPSKTPTASPSDNPVADDVDGTATTGDGADDESGAVYIAFAANMIIVMCLCFVMI